MPNIQTKEGGGKHVSSSSTGGTEMGKKNTKHSKDKSRGEGDYWIRAALAERNILVTCVELCCGPLNLVGGCIACALRYVPITVRII